MDNAEIYKNTGIILFLIISWFVEIPKVKLNVWKWIGQQIGTVLNAKQTTEIKAFQEEVKSELKDMKADIDTTKAAFEDYKHDRTLKDLNDKRQRILRFSDEIRRKERHSEEMFNSILEDIDEYEKYCDDHPKYRNNKADFAIANVKRVYQKTLDENDFLND